LKLIVFDPLFTHRAIEIQVGLDAILCLRSKGYLVYFRETDVEVRYYYVIRCPKCKVHFLSTSYSTQGKQFEDGCPICNGYVASAKISCKVPTQPFNKWHPKNLVQLLEFIEHRHKGLLKKLVEEYDNWLRGN